MKKFQDYIESVQIKRKSEIYNEEEGSLLFFFRLFQMIFKHRKEIPVIVAIMIALSKYYLNFSMEYFKDYKNEIEKNKLIKKWIQKIETVKDDSDNIRQNFPIEVYNNWKLEFETLKQKDQVLASEVYKILEKNKNFYPVEELLISINRDDKN